MSATSDYGPYAQTGHRYINALRIAALPAANLGLSVEDMLRSSYNPAGFFAEAGLKGEAFYLNHIHRSVPSEGWTGIRQAAISMFLNEGESLPPYELKHTRQLTTTEIDSATHAVGRRLDASGRITPLPGELFPVKPHGDIIFVVPDAPFLVWTNVQVGAAYDDIHLNWMGHMLGAPPSKEGEAE